MIPLSRKSIPALTPGEEMKEAVPFTAGREMLVLNLDKMVFAVDRDMTATGGSALDIMEYIPYVHPKRKRRLPSQRAGLISSLEGCTRIFVG